MKNNGISPPIMEKSLSEREFLVEKVKRRKILQSLKKEIVESAQKEVKMVKIVDDLSKNISKGRDFIQSKLEQARQNIKNGTAKTEPDGFYKKDGIEYCNPMEALNTEAIERHGNNPDKRLDECGFPADRRDRNFLLNHNFEDLSTLVDMAKHSWIYLYGDAGRGKTSLATRIAWELIKDHPTQGATFLSVVKWMNSLMFGQGEYIDLSKLSRVVVVDDFDKFDQQKDFQIRHLLRLIEELKNRHIVIITSNYSRDEMLKINPGSLDLKVMLDRVSGKSVDYPRMSGESFRRKSFPQ